MSKEEEKKVSEYELVEVPTQHALAVRTFDNRTVAFEQAVIEMLNTILNKVNTLTD